MRGAAGPGNHRHPLGLASSSRPFGPVPHDEFNNQNPEFLYPLSVLSLFPPLMIFISGFRYSLAIRDSPHHSGWDEA